MRGRKAAGGFRPEFQESAVVLNRSRVIPGVIAQVGSTLQNRHAVGIDEQAATEIPFRLVEIL